MLAMPNPQFAAGFGSLFLASTIKFIVLMTASKEGAGSSHNYIDPRFKRVLWYLIASTKGGANRARIIDLLNSRPSNPNQIATELGIDYKTALHHLKVLIDNGLIITDNKDSYGAVYFLTPLMENNYSSFMEILGKIKSK
jgi:DNA-binding transcriptional ArsR family regulator